MLLASSALIGIGVFLLVPDAAASFVSSTTSLNPNDSVSWSQLGVPGSPIAPSFSAESAAGIGVFGVFDQGSGTMAEVCPAAGCDYASGNGFAAGDFLIWTEDANGNGTGPLTISFSRPVQGAGLYFQLTAPATFAATITEVTPSNGITGSAESSNGNPVFLGVEDSTADTSEIIFAGVSCTPTSPGLCDPSDFAIDRLYLATNVSEPKVMVAVGMGLAVLAFGRRHQFRKGVRTGAVVIPCSLVLTILAFPSHPARAQVPAAARETAVVDSGVAVPGISTFRPLNPIRAAAADTASSLPIWRYQVTSPLDGLIYSGYMVGTSPFNRGARTTTVPVVLIPFIVTFSNTTTGFTTTFDPTTAPDADCTASQTAMSLVENSPVFQNRDWTLNGVYMGNTQYVDAFQRANFWQDVQETGDAYHVLLDYSVGEPLRLGLTYAAPTQAAEVRTGVQGSCTNPGGSGSTNGGGYQGIVDFNTLYDAMTGYIAAHNLTPGQLPIFILYNVMYSQNGLLYLGGYHFTLMPFPQSRISRSPNRRL